MPTSGPLIWSETRQELCESLPYYRAYQTGCYVSSSCLARPPSSVLLKSSLSQATLKDSIAYGYLLAGWPSRRDAFAHNGRVIISHGGGKSQVITPRTTTTPSTAASSEPKKASLKQDQSADDSSTIRALLHSARHSLPIVLIAAENYALLPFKLNCGYAVLGWYLITDAWAEREVGGGKEREEVGKAEGFVRCKFRFEWIEAQGEPWWQLSRKDKEKEWNPRSRIETFSKSQRQVTKRMKQVTKRMESKPSEKASVSSSRPSSAPSSHSSSTPTSGTTTPTAMTPEERKNLLFGPLPSTTLPSLISKTSRSLNSASPCTLTNSASCLSCRHPSPIVFSLGWICLGPSCPQFFLLPNTHHPPLESSLNFSSSFLHPLGAILNFSFPSCQPPFPLIPMRPSSRSMDQSRGLWCKHCGRLSCRELIFQPRCSHCNSAVGKWKPLPTIPPPQLNSGVFDFDGKEGGAFDPVISASSGIKMEMKTVGEGGERMVVYSFTFDAMFGDCAVHLVQADTHGGGEEREADEIFRAFQRHAWPTDSNKKSVGKRKRKESDNLAFIPSPEDTQRSSSNSSSTSGTSPDSGQRHSNKKEECLHVIPFRRHQLKSSAGLGRMLTQQFTCNYGVPYKHIVAMGTLPLHPTSSPPPIISTLRLLQHRTCLSLSCSSPSSSSPSSSSPSSSSPSSSSLSSPTSSFRGFNEIYPVLYLQHQKMSFHDDGEPGLGPIVSSLSLGSTCRMKFRLKSKHQPHHTDLTAKVRTLLDLPLRHGSVVVQQGSDLQKYFEHSVSPDGFRIAVTGRWIDELVNDKTPNSRPCRVIAGKREMSREK
ncbi:hypothetical protein NDA17_005771 [Ustilago hordei]|nr:hypothetical protein NDA17_005771 [Ustilago hordei]